MHPKTNKQNTAKKSQGNGASKTNAMVKAFTMKALASKTLSLFLCLCLILIKRQSIRLPDILFGLLIGIPNYYSARFLLLALNSVPAVIAYPTYSVSTIVCVTAAGVLLFREALDRRRICALMLILISLVFLNL